MKKDERIGWVMPKQNCCANADGTGCSRAAALAGRKWRITHVCHVNGAASKWCLSGSLDSG